MNGTELLEKMLGGLALVILGALLLYSLHQIAYAIAMESLKWANLIPSILG